MLKNRFTPTTSKTMSSPEKVVAILDNEPRDHLKKKKKLHPFSPQIGRMLNIYFLLCLVPKKNIFPYLIKTTSLAAKHKKDLKKF